MKSIMLNLIFLSLSLPVMANTVEFEFSGYIDTINSNENNALGDVYVNQSFDGWFSYSSVPDQYPSSATTGHYHQNASISVTLGTQTLSYIDDYVYIRVYDNYQGEDTFSFAVDASQGDFDFTGYGVRLSDSTGVVFNNDDLPMSFDLAQFDSSRLVIAGYKLPNWDWFDVGGEITNMTLVPRPPTTYYVNASEGSDNNDGLSPETPFATIQKGIDSANDGDTVIVAPGIYTGPGNRDIDFLGKAITVRSENGPDDCVIDCNGTEDEPHRGFYFHNYEDANSILDGFTIIRGYTHAWSDGGGISFRTSSPKIKNCEIIGNSSEEAGGGIHCGFRSSPEIINCTISGNSAMQGGGVSCFHDTTPGFKWNTSPKITDCTITDNSAKQQGGGICSGDCTSPVISNCIITGNSAEDGGGMSNWNSNPMVTNCTFSGNSASNGNALDCDSWSQLYPSNVQMTNCILWDGGNEIWNNDGSTIAITYSDVEGGWAGVGNIDDDPMFVEPGYWADANDPNIIVEPNDPSAVWVDGDYHLLATSPCIDAASDANVYTDIEGNIRPFDFPGIDNNAGLPEFDMGAYEATVQTEGKLLILPETIRRYGQAKKILAILRLPKGITKDQIDSNEPLLLYPEGDPNGIEAASQYVLPSGRGRAKRTIIFAFFDKGELMEVVPDGRVQLHVVGMFDTRRYFHGTDSVWIKGRQQGGRGRGRRR